MSRLPDWEARFDAWVARTDGVAWSDGAMDCALYVAGAVEAITGVDHAARWRGYADVADGLARLREEGFADHVALVASLFPEVPSPRRRAAVGDVAVTAEGALCIVQGPWLLGVAPEGRVKTPRARIARAFAT